jgi:hypothetical protein
MKPPNKEARPAWQQSAHKKQLTRRVNHTHDFESIDPFPFNRVGSEPCCWQPIACVTWVQTRSPEIAWKPGRRRDGWLVVQCVAGGCLHILERRRRAEGEQFTGSSRKARVSRRWS